MKYEKIHYFLETNIFVLNIHQAPDLFIWLAGMLYVSHLSYSNVNLLTHTQGMQTLTLLFVGKGV